MLYETTVRKTQPREKQFKLSDAFGLYLLVKPSGSKLWRYDYVFEGKRKTLALGSYPDVTLSKARQARGEARKLLDEGRDPSYHKKVSHLGSSGGTTFREVSEEYLARFKERDPTPADATMVKKRWLLNDLTVPVMGHMPIETITSLDVLALLKSVEASGRRETAQRMRSEISAVFRHAVTTLRCESDPTWVLRGAIAPPKRTSHPAITEEAEFGRLLTAIDELDGWWSLRLLLQFCALTFPRPTEARKSLWAEYDLKEKVWTIPAARTKSRREHKVPLSRQALAILEEARTFNPYGDYVFPSIRTNRQCMSENAMNSALRRMGYAKHEHTAHGFRSSASTILNRKKFDAEVIELQLAHIEGSVRRIYNRDHRWEERVKLMQSWANLLDTFRLL